MNAKDRDKDIVCEREDAGEGGSDNRISTLLKIPHQHFFFVHCHSS